MVKPCKLCHEFTVKATCEFAYQYAVANHKKIPTPRERNKITGVEWMRFFRIRSNTLTFRTSEATSSPAHSFNARNVPMFFDTLKNAMLQYGFSTNEVFNCDKTGTTTVQRPPKIVAPKG